MPVGSKMLYTGEMQVGDINIRKKYSINILGIKRNGIADVNIDSDTVLPGDTTLLVLGEGKALSRCFHI